jgi:DNA-binding transcriptional ArsR family regulator
MQTVRTADCCVAMECGTPLVREPISEPAADELARVFKALTDPVRLRLVSLIGAHAGGEVCVCDLTAAFELAQPTISHHLRVLREAGLIDRLCRRSDGRRRVRHRPRSRSVSGPDGRRAG